MKNSIFLVLILGTLALSGCGSTVNKIVTKRDLSTSTQMSSTVWLDPVPASKRTVFLQMRNTSDKQLTVEQSIINSLESKGYTILDNPDEAHYWIQAAILKVGKSNSEEKSRYLATGYEGMGLGAITGAQFGSGRGKVGAAVVGALAGAAIESLFEDVMYIMVTDLQISEATKDGVDVAQTSQHNLNQGTSGSTQQVSNEVTQRKKYQTRIVSTANKLNLKFEDAVPQLEEGLTRSIAGIL